MKINPLDIQSVSGCKACPLLADDHCPSYGNPHADVMVVGMTPTRGAIEAAEPFGGVIWEMIEFMLNEADMDRADAYYTNVMKCGMPDKREPMPMEVDMCKDIWLKRELSFVNPKVVILLGADTFKAVIPKSKHDKWGHESVIKSKKHVYLASFAPGYFLRRDDMEGFVSVGKTLKDILYEE